MNNCFNQLILNKIYTYLSLTDLKNCSLVNKNFSKAFDNNILWIFLLNKNYGDTDINVLRNIYSTNNHKIIYKKYKDAIFIKNFFEINEEINFFIARTKLNLNNSHLKSIPKEISSLISLRELSLLFNKLIIIPKEIGLLTGLEQLDLSHNKLTIIPKEIGLLTGLEQLDLYYNKLTTIPKEIGLLTGLE